MGGGRFQPNGTLSGNPAWFDGSLLDSDLRGRDPANFHAKIAPLVRQFVWT